MIVLVLDLEGRIVYANPHFEALAGRSLADFVGADWFSSFLPARDRERVRARFGGAIDGDPTRAFINTIVTADGQERAIEWHDQALRGDAARSRWLVCLGKDVTERRRIEDELRSAEQELRRSLAEKDTLLREIHHRVKNNLQIISSLLHFQAKRVKHPEDAAAFAEGRSRMLAMMLIHERLYQSRELSRIELPGYVRALVAALSRTHAQGHVTIDIHADEIFLPIELALPTGMILCELITNVFKYAAAGRVTCRARVSARSDGERVRLAVDDDGVGFPADFDPETVTTFGWSLVRNLVLQLDGTLVTRTGDGAHVEISFPRAVAAREAP